MTRAGTATRIALALGALAVLGGCTLEDLQGESTAPRDYLAIYDASMQAYARGDLAAAEEGFTVLTREVPREAESWFRLANIYARTNRANLAVEAYQEAVLRQPDLVKAWHNMGVVQLRQAGNSFVELRNRSSQTSPLYERGRYLSESVLRLIESDTGLDGAPSEARATGQGSKVQ